MVWGGRREEGSGWGTHVYLGQIHFDIWQNQYNIVKLNKIKLNRGKKKKNNSPKMSVTRIQTLTKKRKAKICSIKIFIPWIIDDGLAL